MRKLLFIAAIFIGFEVSVSAQVSTISPEKAAGGETVNIAYDTKASGASLDGKETIYARITVYLQNGYYDKFHLTMEGANGRLTNHFKLPGDAASFKAEFYTLNKDDESAAITKLVYDTKYQHEAEGAYLDALFDDNPDSVFRNEMLHYPDNYLAYARFINVVSMIKDHEAAKTQIDEILKKLQTAAQQKQDAGPGLLAALCVGYAKTADLPEGKKYLYLLFNRFPKSAELAFAFSIYNYEYYKASRKDVEDDVRVKLKELFTAYPDACLSHDPNVFYYIKDDKSISTGTFEKALLPLYDSGKLSYYALANLPELYIERNDKLDSAETMLYKAIASYQDGSINHQYRLNYNHYQQYVPLFYMDLVKINLLQKNYRDAITNSSAGISILAGSNAEGNFMPLLLKQRAIAYKQIGNLDLAMEDYKKLYKTGDAAALDSMQVIFPYISVKQKTFAEFAALLKLAGAKATTSTEMAPNFTATDLKGNTIHLSDFKGKLVVLNIWGIGCGPCIAEMPELNKLVKQFSNQSNVVFLALSADKTESLLKFFKDRQFDYRVLNNGGKIAESFNTNALPIHMVIGKNGEIISRSIGARENIKDFLQNVITANL